MGILTLTPSIIHILASYTCSNHLHTPPTLVKMASSSTNTFPTGIKPFAERKFPKTICMFDVDGTLTPARLGVSKEMAATLKKLREYTAVAFVGGSDLVKITEQLQVPGEVGKS